MITFRDANQARMALKMKLSVYGWYGSSMIISGQDGYSVLVLVKRLDNQVRKVISPVYNGVSVRVELE